MTAICNPLDADVRQFHPPNSVFGMLEWWARFWDQTLFLPFNMTVTALMAISPREDET